MRSTRKTAAPAGQTQSCSSACSAPRGAAFALLILLLTSLCLAGQDDWPQFRGNLQLTGLAASAVPENLRVLWTYQAGDPVESSAAIVDGVVYAASQAGELLAIDLATGALRWKYKTGEPVGESSPAVREGVVYAGDLGGALHAVSARDGRPLWTFKTSSEIKSSPVALAGRVLIGSYDTHLYCLSAKQGNLLWKAGTGNYVHATPAVSDSGLAYVAGCDEILRAIRISDGEEIFQISAGSYTAASPALAAGWLFYGTFGNEVVAVNLAARKIAWKYEHAERRFPFYSSAAVSGDRLVLGGRDKMLHCLNTRTGKPLWTFPTRARVDSSPAIAGRRVYAGSNDGRFYVLDLDTGAKLWEYQAGSPLSASPAISRGRIVIGAQDGAIYCFGG
ncbi:MAG: hypothetical protein FJW37_03800 [Acidobacteria bacterium]|nr:hypothetical protein [Acidobacteriota bacterium]